MVSLVTFCAPVLAPVLAAAICACSESPPQPTLDELVRKPGFEQCLRDSGVQPGQISDCMADNPAEVSARDCIAAHVSRNNGAVKGAIDRCFKPQQPSRPDSAAPLGLNCNQDRTGSVTCQ
jgi:hypothetical protein